MSRPPRMLVIAPHPDDEILGAGGTIARFSSAGEVTVLTVAAHMPPLYSEATYRTTLAEARNAHAVVGVHTSVFLGNPAVLLRDVPIAELNASISKVIQEVEPTVLLVPFLDRHIDHRIVFEAALVCARPVGVGRNIQVIAAYETLSETHWNAPHVEPSFAPNWFVDITDTIDRKIEAFRAYESQVHEFPAPRSPEALRALALFRGSQAGMPFAEALYIIRQTSLPEILARPQGI